MKKRLFSPALAQRFARIIAMELNGTEDGWENYVRLATRLVEAGL